MSRTYDSDDLAFPHLPGILDALQDVLKESRLERACTAVPIAGEQVVYEYMGEDCPSYAWARITGAYPSLYDFPNPDPKPAPAVVLASVVELGLMRTHELPDNGDAIDPEDQLEMARRSGAEMKAMLVALCRYAGDDIRISIGDYRPIGPQGGVIGGSWTAILGDPRG